MGITAYRKTLYYAAVFTHGMKLEIFPFNENAVPYLAKDRIIANYFASD